MALISAEQLIAFRARAYSPKTAPTEIGFGSDMLAQRQSPYASLPQLKVATQ